MKSVSLVCSEEVLRERLMGDVADGIRTADVLERSIARLPLYAKLKTHKINTDGRAPEELAEL